MEWYAYMIIIMGIITFLYSITFFLSREQIKLRLKAFFMRKGNNLLWVESDKNGKLNFGVSPVIDGKMSISKNKVYGVESSDIKLVPTYGVTGVLLSEELAKSVNPKNTAETALSPQFLDGIIKRTKATAMGEGFAKIIKIMAVVVGCQVFLLLVMTFIIFKLYTEMQAAGINVQF